MPSPKHVRLAFSSAPGPTFRMDLSLVQEIIHLDGPFGEAYEAGDVLRSRERTVRLIDPARKLGVPTERPRRLVLFEVDHRLHGLPVWDAVFQSDPVGRTQGIA